MKPIPQPGTIAPSFSTVDGRKTPLSTESLRGKKTVLIFLRHLGCPICRMELAHLKQRIGEFKALNAQVVVFVDSGDASVAEFAAREDVQFHLVGDPQHSIYLKYGIERGGLDKFASPGATLKSIRAMTQGHYHGRFEGSEFQLPGDFVLDEEGKILFAHRGKHIGDNTPLDVLLDVLKKGAVVPLPKEVSRRSFLAVGGGAVVALAGGAAYYNHKVDSIAEFSPEAITPLYAGKTSLLFERYPGLRGNLPWLPLGTYPTPVEELPSAPHAPAGVRLFVKRDDKTSPVYGGNKVRKLEHVLAEATLLHRTSLLTLGGIGSNQCLATAIHGGGMGFDVDICVFNQPLTDHVKHNMLADAHAGAHFVYGGSIPGAVLKAARAYVSRSNPYYIPAGATTPLGNIGYMTAAMELEEQVRQGLMPEPTKIFVAAGSCGTSAGLIAGLKLTKLRSRVVAVQITDTIVANKLNIAHLAQATADAARKMDPSIPAVNISMDDFDVETRFFGGTYGGPTKEGGEAIAWAAPHLLLEPTYTGKTLAACLAHCAAGAAGETMLFWNTINSAPLQMADKSALPQDLQEML
jgi:D-cysteine desulfhydrase